MSDLKAKIITIAGILFMIAVALAPIKIVVRF